MSRFATIRSALTDVDIQASIKALFLSLPFVRWRQMRYSRPTEHGFHLKSLFSFWNMETRILGIFETPEIQLALENNYRILDVAEVRIWKPDKISFSLFKDYINTFLKIKAVASGWPKEARCDTEIGPDSTLPNRLCDHKRALLGELEQKEGLVIDEKKTFTKMRVSSSRRNPVPE